MANELKTPEDYQKVLTETERDLINKRRGAWAFLNTEHSSKETKAILVDVRKADAALSEIRQSLLEDDKPETFKVAANDLYKRCRDLGAYTQEIADALDRDFAHCRATEIASKVDVVKNTTFLIAVPGAFIAAEKAGVFDGLLNTAQAAAAGLGLSASVLNRKKILSAFKSVGKGLVITPKELRESITILYLKEATREKLSRASRVFKSLQAKL